MAEAAIPSSIWLTQTKFQPPRLREDLIPRPRLTQLLQQVVKNHHLTLISAPAGYGKTNLAATLSSEAAELEMVWLALDAQEQIEFWQAYSDEIVARLSKADLISRDQAAIAFDAEASFQPDDLVDWHGRILILEGDNDPIAEAAARESLKQLHPQAAVHTFQGTGHVASLARVDEYVAVIRRFLEAEG